MTGPPGSGKTLTVKEIVKKLRALGERIVLLAPTGQACQMLQSVVGGDMPCYTVDMCIYQPGVAASILKYGASVILDEASMLTLEQQDELLMALEGEPQLGAGSGTGAGAHHGRRRTLGLRRLILVGDVDQMGAVGGVSVFGALLRLPAVRKVRLERIWRQGTARTALVKNIEVLRNPARFRFAQMEEDDSFHVIISEDFRADQPRAAAVRRFWEAAGNAEKIRVICFTLQVKGMLNLAIQGTRAESRVSAPIAGRGKPHSDVRFGDLVRCTRNYYGPAPRRGQTGPLLVTNGTIGRVEPGPTGPVVQYPLLLDMAAEYGRFKTEFELGAYASTVHGVQGAESDTVVGVLDAEAYRHPPRELLYTTVTRARTQCVLLMTPQAASLLEAEKRPNPESEKLYRQLAHHFRA